MIKTNITAVLNTQRPDSEGLYPIRIRTTIARSVKYYATGLMVIKAHWDGKEIILHPNRAMYNTVVRKKILEIEKEILESSITGDPVGKKRKNSLLKFSEYAKIHIAAKKKHKKSTKDHKDSYLNKFNEFKPNIKLKDITKDILNKFEIFCEEEKGNINNTVWSAVKFVKTIINCAVKNEILAKNPLKGFEGVKYIDPIRQTLSDEGIIKFEGFADNELNSEKLRNVARWFVFCCYTGLRYSDMKKFKGFTNGRILIKTVKTDELVSMVATDNILTAYARIDKKILSNQKMNDYLKIIAGGLDIDIDMTCHTGRHTFAVKYLRMGGRLEVLQKLLGHKNIETTAIYGKIANVTADEELQRIWGKK